jgi:hypothetical protein
MTSTLDFEHSGEQAAVDFVQPHYRKMYPVLHLAHVCAEHVRNFVLCLNTEFEIICFVAIRCTGPLLPLVLCACAVMSTARYGRMRRFGVNVCFHWM